MKIPLILRRQLFWLNLPSTILIALLQRMPALKLASVAEEMVIASPLGNVLKSALVATASLGAMHTLAGATAVVSSSPSPHTVAVGNEVTLAFSVDGPFPATSWSVSGVPPGLSGSGDEIYLLGGVVTTPGTYNMSLTATGAQGSVSGSYQIIVTGSTATAPSFTTHPQTQTVNVGTNVTFTAAANGSPTPTLQWRKNGDPIDGQTGLTLTLNNVQTTQAGTYSVVATNSAGTVPSNNAVLTVNKLAQTITFEALGDRPYTPTPIPLSATSNSSLTVSFSVLSGPANVSGNNLTLTAAGTVTVRAAQAGDSTYNAAADVDRSFVVSKAAATVTLGNLSATYSGSGKTATATTNPTDLTVDFTYDGSGAHPVNAGSYAVVGTISDPRYQGSASDTLVIAKAAQTITFEPLADRAYSATPIGLSATSNSGLTVSFSLISGPANLAGNDLTLTGPGTVTVQAAQAGDTNYLAAAAVDRSFAVTATNDFETWLQSNFTAGELSNPLISGPTAVYGLDGLPNIVKYALGLDPKVNATSGLPELTKTADDWVYTFTKPASVTDVDYAVEVSTNLSTWTATGVTLELVSTDAGVETWRARYPLASAANIHFRLQITRGIPAI